MSFGTARLATEKAAFRPALLLSILPGITEMQMATKLSYRDQLLHPNWQRRRLEMLDRASFTCQDCGGTEATLHVHHKQYFKGRMAWEYSNDELAVLCADCHKAQHADEELLQTMAAASYMPVIVSLVGGFNHINDNLEPDVLIEALGRDPLAYAAGFVGYITSGLSIGKMLEVARFAASLHHPEAEANMAFKFSRGGIFGESEK